MKRELVKDRPTRSVERVVLDDGRDVHVKGVLLRRHPLRRLLALLGRNAAKREARQLRELAARGIPAAEVVGVETRWSGGLPLELVITTRTLVGHQPLPKDAERDPEVAARLGAWLRRLHDAGVEHQDLHPRNVLRAPDGTLVLLDADRVRCGPPLAPRARRRNLRQVFLGWRGLRSAPAWPRFLEAYGARDFGWGEAQLAAECDAALHRHLWLRSRRALRENPDFGAVVASGLRWQCRRGYVPPPDVHALLGLPGSGPALGPPRASVAPASAAAFDDSAPPGPPRASVATASAAAPDDDAVPGPPRTSVAPASAAAPDDDAVPGAPGTSLALGPPRASVAPASAAAFDDSAPPGPPRTSVASASALLKRTASSTVLRLGDGTVLKASHPRRFRTRLDVALRGSRARRAFRLGHLLELHGLATPRVLAFAEISRSPLAPRSLLIVEEVPEAEHATAFLARVPDPVRRRAFLQACGAWVGALHRAGLSHRDLKGRNVLRTTADQVTVVDLDGLRRPRRLTRSRRLRDLRRMLRSGREVPELGPADALAFLRNYRAFIGAPFRGT